MIAALSLFSLILHFDGSLRPPRDPIPGFTRYTPKSTSVDKMASCSAAIFDDDKLHSIGGKMLDLVPGMTSADAEYEGLLMGLDELIKYLSDEQNLDSWIKNSDVPTLTVKGDCKVIVDQFVGKSEPRKMETKYTMVLSKIKSIQNLFLSHAKKIDSAHDKLPVRFQYIPRASNHLCDALCRLLVNQYQRASIDSIYNTIKLGEAEPPNEANSKPIKMSKKSKKKVTSNNIHFAKALQVICNTDSNVQLSHSSQLALACILASASINQKDVIALNELADLFLLMSRRWGRIYYYDDENSWEIKKTLADLSFLCKDLVEQYSKRGEDEDVTGSSDIVARLQSLYEFFVRTKDMGSSDGVQFPFIDIVELLDEIDEKEWREVLQNWDLAASGARTGGKNELYTGIWQSPTKE